MPAAGVGVLIAFFIALGTARPIGRLMSRWGVEARPGGRHAHTGIIPKAGGWAIVLGFLAAMLVTTLLHPGVFGFVGQTFLGIDRNLFGIVSGALVIALVGFLDDRFGLRPAPKLLLQLGAALLVPLSGIVIANIRNPFGVTVQFADFAPLVTVVWVLLITNTMNYLDGVDGLSAGIGFIAAVVIAALSSLPGVNQPATAILAALLAGAIFGFLPFNLPPAKVFLGDTGAQFIGYMLAIFALVSGGKVATVALVLGIPILDVVWVSLRRVLRGTSPFRADAMHLHHRLLAVGVSPRGVLVLLWSIAAVFGAISFVTTTVGKFQATVLVVVGMIILGAGLVWIESRRKLKGED